MEKVTGGSAGVDAVDRWYAECPNYKSVPSKPSDFTGGPEIGYYTQVVWKDAKKVGCAAVGSIAACLYDYGNMLGEFDIDVPPPGKCQTISTISPITSSSAINAKSGRSLYMEK